VVRVVCMSDTHLVHERGEVEVPDGDILVHTGDATHKGTPDEIRRFDDWYAAFPHRHKIFVAGNHDFGFERTPEEARALLDPSIVYLQDAEATLEGLRFYGSPWQPWFMDWAFNLSRGPEIRAKWEQVPAGIDVLLTHGPPQGIGDRLVGGEEVGCADLFEEITTRIRPRLHVCGHIHEARGQVERDGTLFVNASIADERYRLAHGAIVVDL